MASRVLRPWLPTTLLVVCCGVIGLVAGLQVATADSTPRPLAAISLGGLPGPDVTVRNLTGTNHFGETGGIHAYSVGTDACNIGSEPLNWCDNSGGCSGLSDDQHPVIAQNMYRLFEGRFEQVGMSWLKHGFASLNTNVGADCQGIDPASGNSTACVQPPRGASELGIGCTDVYSSGLNGAQPLGRRSEVDATYGLFPFPPTGGGSTGTIGQRLQIAESDLTSPGARYWAEAHYVADNDAQAGNGLNNASYREVEVSQPSFNLNFVGPTVRERAAIFAWQEVDPEVEITAADFISLLPGLVERFHAARRVTDLGGGLWRYVYAIHNMNSNSSADELSIRFPGSTIFSNVGFRDVDHHSNEPYDTTDWNARIGAGSTTISWSADPASVHANTNALRWGTMFTFWFDADRPPVDLLHTLGIFRPPILIDPLSIEISFENALPNEVFSDGFEAGNTASWSSTVSP